MELLVVLVAVLVLVGLLLRRMWRQEHDLTGQVVLLTGAGGGFGRLLATKLARRGCRVACVDVAAKPNEETVSLVLKEQQQLLGQGTHKVGAKAYTVDLAKNEEIVALVQRVIEDFGCIDMLVSNAGQLQGGSVWEMSVEQADLVLDVNLRATLLLVRALIPHMRSRRRGHIVAVSSVSALVHAHQISVYAATKAGLSHYMGCLYHDLHLEGLHNDIHLTTIQPYFMKTFHVLANLIVLEGWFMKQLFSFMEPDQAAEWAVQAIALRKQVATLPGYMAPLLAVIRSLPASVQIWMQKNLMPHELRPAFSYQLRHKEKDPEMLHELLSKGYPLCEDPLAVCQRLSEDYLAQGKELPHDFAQYADQIKTFYERQNMSIPPTVRRVFRLAG